MVMSRWDPFSELVTLRQAMDKLFDQSLIRPERAGVRELADARTMPIDLYEKEGDYILKAYLPGVKAGGVDIDADRGMVTIKAHIPGEAEQEEARNYNWLVNELGYGDVVRSVTLPILVDAGKIEASVENGILTMTIPKAEEAKPKKIAVKAK